MSDRHPSDAGERAPPYAVICTIGGRRLLVDVTDEDAPVATFVSDGEANRFAQWLAARSPAPSDEPDADDARLDGAGMLFMCLGEKANAKDIAANGPHPYGGRRSLHAVTLTMNEILHALAETELEIAKPRAAPSEGARDADEEVGEPFTDEEVTKLRAWAKEMDLRRAREMVAEADRSSPPEQAREADTAMLDWLLSHAYYGDFIVELDHRPGQAISVHAKRGEIAKAMRASRLRRESPTDTPETAP